MLSSLIRPVKYYGRKIHGMRRTLFLVVLAVTLLALTSIAQQKPDPRNQPGAPITVYAPDQHDLYDGHFVLSANRIYRVGGPH
jgi:hypothetical protein